MPDLEDLSREELIALVLGQMDRINELADKVAKLEHLLSRNRGNSSMPPSLDDKPAGTPPKGKGRATPKRGKGKQKGAPGANLSWSDAPDERKDDYRDAADLADLPRMGRLPEAWIAPSAVRELRELVQHRATVEQRRKEASE